MLKYLFLIVLGLKIGASLYAFQLGFTQTAQPLTQFSVLLSDPIWLWSFSIPFLFMLTYVIVGWLLVRGNSRKDLFSYTDGCYYLGFLFTIASIIIALASIQDENFFVSELAIRFAAAMLTTFVGMAVRLYIITFDANPKDSLTYITKNFFAGPTSDSSLQPNSGDTGTEAHGDFPNETEEAGDKSTPSTQKGIFSGLNNSGFPSQRVDPDEDLNFILQVSCQNLAILNNQLVESINKFSHLVDLMLNTISRLGHDIDVESDKMKAFTAQIQKKTEEVLTQSSENFSHTLSQQLIEFKETVGNIGEVIAKEGEHFVEQLETSLKNSQTLFEKNLNQQHETLQKTTEALTSHVTVQISQQKALISNSQEEQTKAAEKYKAVLESQLEQLYKIGESVVSEMEGHLKDRVEIFAQSLNESKPSLNTATLQSSILDFAHSLSKESETLAKLTNSLELKVSNLLKQTDSNSLSTNNAITAINSMRESINTINSKFDETEKNIETLNNELIETSSKFNHSLDNFKNKLDDELNKKLHSAQKKSGSFLNIFRR